MSRLLPLRARARLFHPYGSHQDLYFCCFQRPAVARFSETHFAALEDLFPLFVDLQFDLQFTPFSRYESFTRSAPHLNSPDFTRPQRTRKAQPVRPSKRPVFQTSVQTSDLHLQTSDLKTRDLKTSNNFTLQLLFCPTAKSTPFLRSSSPPFGRANVCDSPDNYNVCA